MEQEVLQKQKNNPYRQALPFMGGEMFALKSIGRFLSDFFVVLGNAHKTDSEVSHLDWLKRR